MKYLILVILLCSLVAGHGTLNTSSDLQYSSELATNLQKDAENGDDLLDFVSSAEELDEMPTLYVEPSNSYCDFTKSFGPLCNMTGVDRMLTISYEKMPANRFLEVEVHNASRVALYPVCLPWVQIFAVRDFLTLLPKEDYTRAYCRTWLRSYDSHISSLTNGLKDVSLVNTSVELINLHGLRDFLLISSNVTIIEHLDWRGYAGIVKDSIIRSMMSFQANENLTMENVLVESISSHGFQFEGKQLEVNMTTFEHVSEEGMQIKKGAVTILNTVFHQIGKRGIDVDFGVYVNMQNVSIKNCVTPCLVFSSEYYVILRNVTIEGRSLEEFPEAVQYKEDDSTTSGSYIRNSSYCIEQENSLQCDFIRHNEVVFVSGRQNFSGVTLNIKNAKNFHIVGACDLSIHLTNSQGQYTKHDGTMARDNCRNGGNLTSVGTKFEKLIAKNLDFLNLTSSHVSKFRAETITEMVLNRSSISATALIVQEKAVWQKSKVYISNATILGQFEATDMTFREMSDVTFGNLESNSTISNSEFVTSRFIVNGFMVLRNVSFRSRVPYGIVVTDQGKLHMEDTRISIFSYHAISVSRSDQVTWEGVIPEDMMRYVHIRRPGGELANATLAGPHEENCIMVNLVHPFLMLFSSHVRVRTICNYTGEPIGENVQVLYNNNVRENLKIPSYRILRIIGAKKLTLSSFCEMTLQIENVQTTTMEEADGPCDYLLMATNSSLENITNNPTEVSLFDSTVNRIESISPMNIMIADNSSVGSINIRSKGTIFNKVNISSIDHLDTSRVVNISNSNIDQIKNLNIKRSGQIINSTIQTILKNGITVNGQLSMTNVTIHTLNRNGITVKIGAILKLENVIIKQGWINSISHIFSIIQLKNVTLNGLPLEEVNRLKIEKVTEQSLSTPQEKITTTSKTDETTSTASVVTEPSAHNSSKNKVSEDATYDVPHDSLSSTTTSEPWVKWATAGAAVFMALTIVAASLSVVLLVKRQQHGRWVVPRLFSRTQVDETVLATEMNVTNGTDYIRLAS